MRYCSINKLLQHGGVIRVVECSEYPTTQVCAFNGVVLRHMHSEMSCFAVVNIGIQYTINSHFIF